MKNQIQFSPDIESNSGTTEPVKRLADRYNIPEKDVEALLYGSRAPKGEALGSHNKGKSMAEEFRSNYGGPPRQNGWSPINVLSAIVGILGILALTIILISVIQRHNYHMGDGMPHPPPPMTGPNPPPPVMSDTAAAKSAAMNTKQDEVPPPAATNEIETKSAPKAHRSTINRLRIRGYASSGFSTSNSIEAQERLAEMRAEGNSRAKIHGKSKNGVTMYDVR